MNAPAAQPGFFPAEHKTRILEHMNADHADAVLRYAHHYAACREATEAVLNDIDAFGIDVVVTETGGSRSVRIAFEQPLTTPDDARHVLIAMAQAARTALGDNAPDSRQEVALARAREVATAFRRDFRTIVLGTISPEGEPDASVAAAVLGADGAFYVYVSTLSTHTRNLLNTRRGSVLLIEDEAAATQLLARKRLTFPCTAELMPRGGDVFTAIMAALKAKFGPVMEHLETMTDFQLVRLAPAPGRLVTGFGRAYDVDPADWSKLSHFGGGGHGHTAAKKEKA
mgnify:FL=1